MPQCWVACGEIAQHQYRVVNSSYARKGDCFKAEKSPEEWEVLAKACSSFQSMREVPDSSTLTKPCATQADLPKQIPEGQQKGPPVFREEDIWYKERLYRARLAMGSTQNPKFNTNQMLKFGNYINVCLKFSL